MRVVCDASVLVKLLLPEPDSHLASAIAAEYVIVVPDFALLEVTNALWAGVHDGGSSTDDALYLFHKLERFEFDVRPLHPWIERALVIACAIDHPIYDCVYLAIAEEFDIPFVTADRRFLTALRRASVSIAEIKSLANFA